MFLDAKTTNFAQIGIRTLKKKSFTKDNQFNMGQSCLGI